MVKISPTLRFKLLVGAALVVLGLGNGFALMQIQDADRADCRERAERAAATAPALAQIATAARADGDAHMAKVWEEYLKLAKENPLPKC